MNYTKKYSNGRAIAFMAFFSVLLFGSCLKEGDDTVALPTPISSIPYSIVPENLQDSLRAHGFHIHEGNTPPTVNGSFLSEPMILDYASDGYQNAFADLSMQFSEQTKRNKVTYTESQLSTVQGRSILAQVIGSGKDFTVYCIETIAKRNSNGDTLWASKTATVISGTVTDNGISDCQYALVILDLWTSSDEYAFLFPPIETYRIWHDGDGLACRTN